MIVAAVMVVGLPGFALACRCIEPSPAQAYKAAQGVVFGEVISVRKENERGDVVYVFEVAESWKHNLERQITIHSGTTCSFNANAGLKYVLFLRQTKSGNYDTGQCMGNQSEAKAGPTLQYLRAMKPAK
ncbi:MAG TPA: hypothetical protein VKP67_06885 [Xanthobacteraceae bacterium]|nr:hypothetical protein [Xanthobacteraceae bacterium]